MTLQPKAYISNAVKHKRTAFKQSFLINKLLALCRPTSFVQNMFITVVSNMKQHNKLIFYLTPFLISSIAWAQNAGQKRDMSDMLDNILKSFGFFPTMLLSIAFTYGLYTFGMACWKLTRMPTDKQIRGSAVYTRLIAGALLCGLMSLLAMLGATMTGDTSDADFYRNNIHNVQDAVEKRGLNVRGGGY